MVMSNFSWMALRAASTRLLTDTSWVALIGGMLFLLGGVRVGLAQDCVPHATAAIPIDGDTGGADDWDTIEKLTLTYGPATTHLVTDATYLYVLTEVTTSLSDPDQQTFVLGAEASNGLRVRPFQASDTAPEGPNSNLWQLDAGFGSWAWSGAAPPNTDFQRVLLQSPERWVLEGRLPLTGLGITDRDSFDLFLHVAVGTSGSALHYWPAQGSGFVDVAEPSGLTFGEVRCPAATFSEPYISFGKQEIGGSSTLSVDLSNGGASGSTLNVSNIALDPAGAPFTITGGSMPPTLSTSDSPHTITLQYAPTSGTTIGSPDETELVIASNDPGNSETRLPVQGHARDAIQFVFILDQSGSMLGNVDGVQKWDATKWATNVAYESMRLYSADNDRVGSVWFGGPSSTPQSGVLSALAPFGTNPLDYAGTFTQQAQSNFFTPIGFGLEEGHDLFSGTVRHVGLLMSDGLHNRPTPTSGAEVVADLNLPSAVQNNTKSMEIFTVAFGTESSVSTELLDDIRQHYQPPGSGTTYNIQEVPENLAEAFIEPFMEPMIVNRIAPTSTASPFDFPVEQNAEAVVGMVVWGPTDTPADIKVDVFDETNSTLVKTYTSSSSEATYHKGSGSGQPYTYLFVDDAEEFDQNYTWRIRTPSGAIPGTAATLAVPVVLVDLNVRALFDATQDERAGTGDVYRLTADLEEVGRPITGSSVDVRAQLRKPGEGLGTLASTVNLDDCSVREPSLPPPIKVTDDVVLNDDVIQQLIQRRLSARSMRFDTRRAVAATAQQADPASYRIAWATAYEARCGPLAQQVDPGLPLVDDGTHGDAVAGDGVHTLDYTSTDYEGTYVVTFTARGETPTGARFSRTRTMASYVPVMVDPLVSQFDWRDLGESNNIVLREYFVVPQSTAGEYLGPDKGSFVSFTIDGPNGTFASDLVDYRNGIYAQLVRYDKRQGAPDVAVTVRGTTITEPTRGTRGAELVFFAGRTFFDDALRLENGWGLGGRVGFPLFRSRKVFGEIELASTLTNVTSADTVRLAHVVGNLRYDLIATRPQTLSPFVTVGGGIGRVWGEGADETVALLHAGGGLSYFFSRRLGVRATARALRLSSVRGADAPINLQLTAGIVFRPRP